MSEWKHPDSLDQVSASPPPPRPGAPEGPSDAVAVLRKVLVTGRLTRIPRHPGHREVVLGILCSGLRRRYPYREMELNECLRESLARMQAAVDHVTCRRYLVDLGFLKRDRGGLRYLLNFPKLESVLSADARASADDIIQQALAHSRG